MLESISDSMVSSGILPGAFIEVWNMCKDDSVSVRLLQLLKLVDEPLKLISSVGETSPCNEVSIIANIGIQGYDLCVVRKTLGKVTVLNPC